MNKKNSNLPNNQFQATNSVVNLGEMGDVTYNQGIAGKKEQKSKDELVQEILNDCFNYMSEINQLDDLEKKEKDIAIQAIMDVRNELEKPQPDEQKIKSIWELIRNTSYLAAICSGISDLFDLIK